VLCSGKPSLYMQATQPRPFAVDLRSGTVTYIVDNAFATAQLDDVAEMRERAAAVHRGVDCGVERATRSGLVGFVFYANALAHISAFAAAAAREGMRLGELAERADSELVFQEQLLWRLVELIEDTDMEVAPGQRAKKADFIGQDSTRAAKTFTFGRL